MKARRQLAILAGVAMLAFPAAARDVKAGHIVALHFCASCHEIEKGNFRNIRSPSFATIAGRPVMTVTSMEMFLGNPYYGKPDFLTRQEIEDVSAYIFSLK